MGGFVAATGLPKAELAGLILDAQVLECGMDVKQCCDFFKLECICLIWKDLKFGLDLNYDLVNYLPFDRQKDMTVSDFQVEQQKIICG